MIFVVKINCSMYRRELQFALIVSGKLAAKVQNKIVRSVVI